MIGRYREQKELINLYNGSKPEFIAVYGRRRVGKTYLINETFKEKITFRHTGLSPVEGDKRGILKSQLEQFYYSLLSQGMKRNHRPESWLEAFFMLETFLEEKNDGERQVIFLDELPWLDTPRSGFITALEGFWNNYCANRDRIMLIVCGSSSSWILDKLINNHGGLYNRITHEIKLSPFTLAECEAFFTESKVMLSRYDITQAYMITGGIPYYLYYFEGGLSLAQNVDNLFFSKQAKLRDEYDRLYLSVFENPDYIKSIVELLCTRSSGYSKKEITKKMGISDGSRLTEGLRALISGDFVVAYQPFGRKGREKNYKLIDPFCIFWLRFVKDNETDDEHFWQNGFITHKITSWRGYAFENVCFNHIGQIKNALGISGVEAKCSSWSKTNGDDDNTQVDLLIERNDNVINACEIKYSMEEFKVDKKYFRTLLKRQEILSKEVSRRMAIHNTLITTFGLSYNEYSGIFSNVITLDDLFT